jgi:hypothetical protein
VEWSDERPLSKLRRQRRIGSNRPGHSCAPHPGRRS